ncbi:MAG: DUF3570 domain-containing protein [Methylococcaceae bacterium]|nr:DUF3570 domain-containing protein [Methylococcaceae bacterium]
MPEIKRTTKASANKGKVSVLMLAALTLPIAQDVNAESAPNSGIISFKHLDYLDSQDSVPDTFSGASSSTSHDRMRVKANSVMIMAPIAGKWSVSGSYTTDSISGASPSYHSSQLIKIDEFRKAGNFNVTRYLPRGTLSLGASFSNESDYQSRGVSLQGTVSSENNNTTFSAGVGILSDEINSNNGDAIGEKKHVSDWLLGVTQVLTVNDIMQINLGYSDGRGYFTDPYKFLDNRPSGRDHFTVLTGWNHHFNSMNATSRLSYRYYDDSYDIKAHTLTAEYVQPFENGWTVTPSVRFYSQKPAMFYVGVDPDSPGFIDVPAVTDPSKYISLDQRLAEYGALTLGIKVSKKLDPNWLIDFKYEHYMQKEEWALTGNNDTALETFSFRSFQLGISRKF